MSPRIVEAVERLKVTFSEIPGTRLSVEQASRLAGVEPFLCESLISALEDAHILWRGRDGRYCYPGGFLSRVIAETPPGTAEPL